MTADPKPKPKAPRRKRTAADPKPLQAPRVGQRGKLAVESRKRLLDAIRGGNYQETACAYAGIGASTFYDWLARGRAVRDRVADGEDLDVDSEDAAYLALLDDVEKARADAEVRAIAQINLASQDSWQASAWWLERTMPTKYGRFTRTEVSGPQGGPLTVSHVSVDELAEALEQVLGQQ